MLFSPRPPYDLALATRLLDTPLSSVAEYVVDGNFRRALLSRGTTMLLQARSIGTVTEPAVELSVLAPEGVALSSELADRFRIMLSCDLDLVPLYEQLSTHPAGAELSRRLIGLKPIHTASLFEALLIAVTEQQVSLAAALAIRKRIGQELGHSVAFEGRQYWTLPSPEDLLACKIGRLRALGLSATKEATLLSLARLAVSGELDPVDLSGLPAASIVRTLTAIKGVGPWTAQYAILRGLRRYDSVPTNDHGLLRGMQMVLGSDQIPDHKAVGAYLKPFEHVAGLAAFYFIVWYALGKYASVSHVKGGPTIANLF